MSYKIVIASDLHGDAACTDLLLKRAGEAQADLLVLLGDLLYHGPRNDLPSGYAPKRVIELLNHSPLPLLTVRGNCDTEVDQMVLSFPILSEIAVLMVDQRRWYLTHGHRYHTGNPLPLQASDLMLMGHTHVPKAEHFGNDNICLNPGSVSIPKENSPKSYLVYENGIFRWKDLETGEAYRELSIG